MKYSIKITGDSNVPSGIVDFDDKIRKVFLYPIESPKYLKFKAEHKTRMLEMFPTNAVLRWQLEKMSEIRDLSMRSVKLDIVNSVVKSDVSFDIDFPDDWDLPFVKDWAFEQSVGELNKVYTFINRELDAQGITDEEMQNMFEFLGKDFVPNMKIVVTKL